MKEHKARESPDYISYVGYSTHDRTGLADYRYSLAHFYHSSGCGVQRVPYGISQFLFKAPNGLALFIML